KGLSSVPKMPRLRCSVCGRRIPCRDLCQLFPDSRVFLQRPRSLARSGDEQRVLLRTDWSTTWACGRGELGCSTPPAAALAPLVPPTTLSTLSSKEPHMEFIERGDVKVFSKLGIESHQLLFPENSSSSRVTISYRRAPPIRGTGTKPPSRCGSPLPARGVCFSPASERWRFGEATSCALQTGTFTASKTPGRVPFMYLSITSPPINFRQAYDEVRQGA